MGKVVPIGRPVAFRFEQTLTRPEVPEPVAVAVVLMK